jgi:hypothetical protein
VKSSDDAGERRGQLDRGLGRQDFGEGLVNGDDIPRRDKPSDDLGVLEALAQVR